MEVLSLGLLGLEAHPVRLRAVTGGPSGPLSVIGLPEAAAREARLRVRAALQQLGVEIHDAGLVITIEPPDLAAGGALDLPIAVSALLALKLLPAEAVKHLALLGELSLNGALRPVRGVLPRLQGAARLGISGAIVSSANAQEAALVEGLQVFAAEHLREVVEHLQGIKPLASTSLAPESAPTTLPCDLDEVRGLEAARRALEVAAAGGHDLLLIGPPGTVKHPLARQLSSLLPPMSREEALKVTAIRSVAGLIRSDSGVITTRPVRAPHYSVSAAGLLGGGDPARPGEVSLAHHGILLLDELHEFRRSNLDALARVLDEERATIVRAKQRVNFPAKVMLVGAILPCPCGFLGTSRCACSPPRIAAFREERLAGPLFERFDVRFVVPPANRAQLPPCTQHESAESVQARVVRARARQQARADRLHTQLSAEELAIELPAEPRLSEIERGRVLRVARTLADLADSDAVLPAHVEEALHLTTTEGN